MDNLPESTTDAQQPTPPVPPPAPIQQTPLGEALPKKLPIKLMIGIGIGVILLLALLILSLSTKKTPAPVKPTPTVTPRPTTQALATPTPNQTQTPVMQFLPGKQYYNDSISIITKDSPHQLISSSVTRVEQDSNYLQYTTITYFDGTTWNRDTLTSTTTNSTIANNTIVRNWSSTIGSSDKSPDLAVTVAVNNAELALSKKTLLDEINVLSLPDYTKFYSQGIGSVKINNADHDAYFVYTRAYSLNASSLAFLNTPAALTTEWLSLWDDQGNFYLIDTLGSQNTNSRYQNYQVAAMQDPKGGINKSTNISVSRNSNDAGRFVANFGNSVFDFAYLTSLNKAGPNDQYVWTVGPVDGSVKQGSGDSAKSSYALGIFENIQGR